MTDYSECFGFVFFKWRTAGPQACDASTLAAANILWQWSQLTLPCRQPHQQQERRCSQAPTSQAGFPCESARRGLDNHLNQKVPLWKRPTRGTIQAPHQMPNMCSQWMKSLITHLCSLVQVKTPNHVSEGNSTINLGGSHLISTIYDLFFYCFWILFF